MEPTQNSVDPKFLAECEKRARQLNTSSKVQGGICFACACICAWMATGAFVKGDGVWALTFFIVMLINISGVRSTIRRLVYTNDALEDVRSGKLQPPSKEEVK